MRGDDWEQVAIDDRKYASWAEDSVKLEECRSGFHPMQRLDEANDVRGAVSIPGVVRVAGAELDGWITGLPACEFPRTGLSLVAHCC